MPDVRLPNGTIVTNVPEGITQSQLMARLQKAKPMASMGPSKLSNDEIHRGAISEVQSAYDKIASEQPWIERDSTSRAALPVAGGIAGSMLGPAGTWAGLTLGSLGAGAGAAGGELIAQKLRREPTDVKAAAVEGGKTAVGNFVGGAILKGLGAAASKLFSSPLEKPGAAAADFAREKGLPFPLSSAAPGSKAGNIQQATRALLPGELKTQADANTVAQFLNREVSAIQAQGSPIDEAAVKGQQFLRKVFEPGEAVYTDTFAGMREAIGDNTPIALTNTKSAMEGVSEALKNRGEMKSVFNRVRNILKANPETLTAQQLDELYSGLLKDVARNANARPEANVVLNAIADDIETVGQQFGVSFKDQLSAAKAVRDEFRELRKVPGLERLAKDFGEKRGTLGSRQWMAELFGNPNGKALAELRARNPELYHELADSWLADGINKFSRSSDTGIGRVLDGPKMRAWYEQNADKLKLIFGSPQAKALDNFTNYASVMSGASQRAVNPQNATSLFARGAGEVAALYANPFLMAPTEAGSYVLAKGLSDPNSTLFKLFTQGVKPSTLTFMQKSAEISGQGALRDKESR